MKAHPSCLDGTLVTQEKVLTRNARQVVAQLGQAGILFAITNGRPPLGMQTLIKDLNYRSSPFRPIQPGTGSHFTVPGNDVAIST